MNRREIEEDFQIKQKDITSQIATVSIELSDLNKELSEIEKKITIATKNRTLLESKLDDLNALHEIKMRSFFEIGEVVRVIPVGGFSPAFDGTILEYVEKIDCYRVKSNEEFSIFECPTSIIFHIKTETKYIYYK